MSEQPEKKKIEIQLPNPGFYESIWSSNIENAIQYEADYLCESNEELSEAVAMDKAYEAADFPGMRRAIASFYAETWFPDAIVGELELEKYPDFKYVGTLSPREYNFHSDAVVAEVDEETAKLLYRILINRDDVRKRIKHVGTDAPGYIPFYPADYRADEWKFENLNPVQWEALLWPFYSGDDTFYSIDDAAYNALEGEDWFHYKDKEAKAEDVS